MMRSTDYIKLVFINTLVLYHGCRSRIFAQMALKSFHNMVPGLGLAGEAAERSPQVSVVLSPAAAESVNLKNKKTEVHIE